MLGFNISPMSLYILIGMNMDNGPEWLWESRYIIGFIGGLVIAVLGGVLSGDIDKLEDDTWG